MTEASKRKPLPGWSRVLIATVVVLFLGSISSIIYGASEFQKAFQQSDDPVYISKVAKRIAAFPEKLPSDYKYVFGADLNLFWSVNMRLVAIDYKEGVQQLIFIGFNQKSKPQEMLGEAYRIGINTHGFSGRFTKSVSQGSWTIQGTRMPYVIGKVKGSDGNMHIGLVSCMSVPKKNKTVLFYALQPNEKEKFDINVCIELLKVIASFS